MTRLNIKLIHRNNILYCKTKEKILLHFSLFKYISSSFLHPSSMMSRDVVVDHSSKELLLQTLTLLPHCFVHTRQMVNIIHRHSGFFNFVDLLHLHWSFFTAATPTSTPLSLLDSSFHSAELL